ncbi:MAG: gluconate 2-dehydrogenase subunit 3 family protein [Alphaproteobacteria bacterium]|nr:gluconate 2-dehydrogenase subunit 3 family protein [Alphaproteobacteria bacterium]
MKQSNVARRRFLQGSAAAAAGASLGMLGPWADALAAAASMKVLSRTEVATILVVARRTYPHDRLADKFYMGVVATLDDKAAGDSETAKLLSHGVARINKALGKPFKDASPEQQLAVLRGMQADGFFQAVRGTSITALYGNKELWALFGYEGSSYEFGGYLHRGFNDLSWLPDPPETASPKPE